MTSDPHAPRRRTAEAVRLHELHALARARGGRLLVGMVGLVALLTVVGLLALWPWGDGAHGEPEAGTRTVGAEITAVTDRDCPGSDAPGQPTSSGRTAPQCRTITVDPVGALPPGVITVGPAEGSPSFGRGDRVRVAELPPPTSAEAAAIATERYSLIGVDRSGRLLVVAVLLGLLALVALRVRGLLALLGVGLSLLLLVSFLVPAILTGRPPLLVALVGALAVMFVTLVLTHGLGAQTLAGALGISLTLVLTTAAGWLGVRYTGLDGTGGELAILLAQARPGVSLEGVLLAGMVIGGLGVLADTAVTQASAVMALRHTDPSLRAAALYQRAVVVGRDHLAATIHTLVLAYAGTVLPLLLVLRAGASGVADAVNQPDLADPILATVVGCAGLVVAVPLTTALAALLVARIPAEVLPADGGHVH